MNLQIQNKHQLSMEKTSIKHNKITAWQMGYNHKIKNKIKHLKRKKENKKTKRTNISDHDSWIIQITINQKLSIGLGWMLTREEDLMILPLAAKSKRIRWRRPNQGTGREAKRMGRVPATQARRNRGASGNSIVSYGPMAEEEMRGKQRKRQGFCQARTIYREGHKGYHPPPRREEEEEEEVGAELQPNGSS